MVALGCKGGLEKFGTSLELVQTTVYFYEVLRKVKAARLYQILLVISWLLSYTCDKINCETDCKVPHKDATIVSPKVSVHTLPPSNFVLAQLTLARRKHAKEAKLSRTKSFEQRVAHGQALSDEEALLLEVKVNTYWATVFEKYDLDESAIQSLSSPS